MGEETIILMAGEAAHARRRWEIPGDPQGFQMGQKATQSDKKHHRRLMA